MPMAKRTLLGTHDTKPIHLSAYQDFETSMSGRHWPSGVKARPQELLQDTTATSRQDEERNAKLANSSGRRSGAQTNP